MLQLKGVYDIHVQIGGPSKLENSLTLTSHRFEQGWRGNLQTAPISFFHEDLLYEVSLNGDLYLGVLT